MKKKLNSIILGTLLLCGKINAQEPERITGVWYLSQPGDLVGGGKAKIYILDQAAVFYSSSNRNHIGISFERTPSNFWHAVFGSADNKVLTPGIYKEARRNKKGYPILDIWRDGRGYNGSRGEFEILEIEYDENEQLESFAVNFIQRGLKGCDFSDFDDYSDRLHPAMFGGIRYNSSIPFEHGFITKFAERQLEHVKTYNDSKSSHEE